MKLSCIYFRVEGECAGTGVNWKERFSMQSTVVRNCYVKFRAVIYN